jgi:hypothetical protein
MIVPIVGMLAVFVLIGSVFLVYGARRTSHVPSKAITVAFALTAASWLAFLIALIGATVILLALPRI